MDLLPYAAPFFLLAIMVELLIDRARGTGYYRLNDAITSLGTGVLAPTTALFTRALLPYAISSHYATSWNITVVELGSSGLAWVVAFILYDLAYYWSHRTSHVVNIFWAAHIVHHQSEEYNLTTALRQPNSNFLLGGIFYAPLALLGIEPEVFFTVSSLNLAYQFWVHTRHVGKLGWYEYVFVTPSIHRVHHAQNPQYIDKNFGGVSILWDRMFGTFQEELGEAPPTYGIRKPVHSFNPWWVNVHYYVQMCRDAWYTSSWTDKLTLWFRRTGYRPEDMEARFPISSSDLAHYEKFDPPCSAGLRYYALAQHIVTLFLAVALLATADRYGNMFHVFELFLTYLCIVFSTVANAWLLEGRRHAWLIESLRLALVGSSLILLAPLLEIHRWYPVLWLLLSFACLTSLHGVHNRASQQPA
jgi:sterol desaturase/sphingolipid hydroxylase (fatty acid hydroxylase superfamily)